MDDVVNTNADAGVVADPPVAAPTAPVTEQPTAPATKAPRAAGVKGVTKTARDLKTAGKTRAEVFAAITDLYKANGKTEKQAKDSASVIIFNIFGPVKTKTETPAVAAETPAPTTPA